MNLAFQAIGSLAGAFLGSKTDAVATTIFNFVIDSLPPDAKSHRAEQWFADHQDTNCPKLKLGSALSLAWRMRYCVTARMIIGDTEGEQQSQQRIGPDSIQTAAYSLLPRIIDELPEEYISVRVRGNIYVISKRSNGMACLLLKERSMEGVAMRRNQDSGAGSFVSRVVIAEDVARTLVAEAIEPSPDWLKHITDNFKPNEKV